MKLETLPLLIKKALYFSAEHHNGQYRKGGKIPYIVHPVLVAFTVNKYITRNEVIAAALLHDTLEDCESVSLEMLQREFGEEVSNLVNEVSYVKSKDEKHLSWKERKEKYIKNLGSLSSDALHIVAVDKMCNMQSYFDAVFVGVDVSQLPFGGTVEEYRWYYGEVGNVLEEGLKDTAILDDYWELFSKYK